MKTLGTLKPGDKIWLANTYRGVKRYEMRQLTIADTQTLNAKIYIDVLNILNNIEPAPQGENIKKDNDNNYYYEIKLLKFLFVEEKDGDFGHAIISPEDFNKVAAYEMTNRANDTYIKSEEFFMATDKDFAKKFIEDKINEQINEYEQLKFKLNNYE